MINKGSIEKKNRKDSFHFVIAQFDLQKKEKISLPKNRIIINLKFWNFWERYPIFRLTLLMSTPYLNEQVTYRTLLVFLLFY